MSQDPFQEHEAEKYTNPIPSQEFILKHLTKHEKPASHDELAVELHIEGKEQLEGLHRHLHTMEHDGQLVFTHHQCYALPEHLNLVKGTIIGHHDGYSFLQVEGHKDDLYLSSKQMKTCIHGNQVLAQPLGTDHKGHHEAHIVHVLVPKTSQIVGRYFTEAGISFVVPDNSHLSFNILIPPNQIMGTRMGFVVIVKLTQRPTRHTKAVGKIIKVLGNNMGTSMAVDITLHTHEIPYIWPQAVEQQVARLKEEVPEEAKAGHVDLHNLPLVTIDGKDTHDFDNAVYCKKKHSSSWRLWVTIANISYYVHPSTPLDREARNHGTSVYFPSQVIPMLPEVLSNSLCSLNPQVDHLCMVCKMTVSSKGHLTGYKFYKAVMSSHTHLTYTKVWHILQGNQDLHKQYTPLVKHLKELHNLYKVLDKAHEEHSGISFESKEAKFIFNTEHHIEHIKQTQHNNTHKLIEECMILANISAARFIEKAKEPALFHIHNKPSTKAITSFHSVLAELGLELPGSNKPEPRDYTELLESVANHPDAEMLQTMLLRSMKQAIYNPENHGHFGLALQSYAHFTSPIHHYPDLTLHHAIKYLLAKEQGHQGNTTETSSYHYSMEEMLQLGQHCSMAEHHANKATHNVADWLKCDFMLNQVGNIFKGIISSITGFGFFIHLDNLFIDGLVHVSSLDNDYYHFDQVGQHLMGESSSQTYHLGNHMEVHIKAVNMDKHKINFSLISSKHAPRNISKTARKKAKKGNAGKKGSKHHQVSKKVNFEPDSTFHSEKKTKPKAAKKDTRKAKKPSAKTQKIAAATKAKHAAKKKVAE